MSGKLQKRKQTTTVKSCVEFKSQRRLDWKRRRDSGLPSSKQLYKLVGQDWGLDLQGAIPVLMMLRTLGANTEVLKALGQQVTPGRSFDAAATKILDATLEVVGGGSEKGG